MHNSKFFFPRQNDPNMQMNMQKQASYGATENIPYQGNPFNQGAPANNFAPNPGYSNNYDPNQGAAPANNFAPNPGNPFAYPNTIQEEPVQPHATDAYMHGNVEDRSFREY